MANPDLPLVSSASNIKLAAAFRVLILNILLIPKKKISEVLLLCLCRKKLLSVLSMMLCECFFCFIFILCHSVSIFSCGVGEIQYMMGPRKIANWILKYQRHVDLYCWWGCQAMLFCLVMNDITSLIFFFFLFYPTSFLAIALLSFIQFY